jgi:hypothetical protein
MQKIKRKALEENLEQGGLWQWQVGRQGKQRTGGVFQRESTEEVEEVETYCVSGKVGKG